MKETTRELLTQLIAIAAEIDDLRKPVLFGAYSDEHLRLLNRCATALGLEPELQHLDESELGSEVLRLFRRVLLNQPHYRESESVQALVDEAWARLARKPVEHEVMFPLLNLKLSDPCWQLLLGDVTVRMCRDEDVQRADWLSTERIRQKFLGRPVVITTEASRSVGDAVEGAQEKCDSALNFMRVCLLWPTTEYSSWMHDPLLQVRRGEDHLVRELSQVNANIGWNREHTPVQLTLDKNQMGSLETVRERLAPILDSTFPPKLREPLVRGVQWAGTSPVQPILDHKIISLCTALECFLTARGDKNKGAAIALHTMLLGLATRGVNDDPLSIYRLYELRSDIVHGSELSIATERNFRDLMRITLQALDQTIDFVKANPILDGNKPVNSISRFLHVLDSPERLDHAIEELYYDDRPAAKKIVEFATKRRGS